MVKRLLVEQGVDIARELYLGIVLDRGVGRVVVMASTEGGMEIEEVAAKHAREDPQGGRRPGGRPGRPSRRASSPSGSACTATPAKNAAELILQALRARSSTTDALAARDQPAGRHSRTASVLALDAKINFDDNALFRHPELEALRDLDEEDPSEIEAKQLRPVATSRSTATSAAWSTAPAWRWRRWTSSSTSAASPRTSSTSAAAPPRSRSPRRSRSSPPTRR